MALGSAEFGDRGSSLVVVVGGQLASVSLAEKTLSGPYSLLERVCLSNG